MSGNLCPIAKCGNASSSTSPDVQALEMAMACCELNRSTLARRLRVGRNTVQRWMSGEITPNIGSIVSDPDFAVVYFSRLTAILAHQVGRAA